MKFIIAIILLSVGAYSLLIEFMDIPSDAPIRALRARSKYDTVGFSRLLKWLEKYIAKNLTMDEERQLQLQRMLDVLGITKSAKEFEANRKAVAVLYSAVGLFLMPMSIYMSIIFVCAGLVIYKLKRKELEDMLKQHRDEVELELPQFAATITQELSFGRNIELILERYSRVCGAALRQELEHTLTSIRTSSVEKALSAFSVRIASPRLTDLIRGLSAVARGEEQRAYFEVLTEELIKNGNAIIRKQQSDKPSKMKIWQLLLFIMFGVLIAVPLILQIVVSITELGI